MSESTEIKVGGLNASLRVIIIDDESDKIPQTLGITPEREKELDEVITAAYHTENSTITDNFVEMSKSCKHANELAYCIFHIGARVGRGKALSDLSEGGLGSLLAAMGQSKRNKSKGTSDETND
jgi:hypothetical protein